MHPAAVVRRSKLLALSVVPALLSGLTAGRALAEPRWYGRTILATDATLVGLGFAIDREQPVLAYGTALSGPVIHLIHDRPLAAGASFALRLGLAWGGAIAGFGVCGDPEGYGCDGYVLGGAVVGVAAASLLDAALLSRPRARPREFPVVSPALQVGRSAASIGVAAAF